MRRLQVQTGLGGAGILVGEPAEHREAPDRAGHEVAGQRVLQDHGGGRQASTRREHAAEYELIVNGIKDETDLAGRSKLVEQMIAQQVNAIVIAPADSKALVPVCKRAQEAGIVVVNIDNKLDAEVLAEQKVKVPFVGPDNRAGAQDGRRVPGQAAEAGRQGGDHRGHPDRLQRPAAQARLRGRDEGRRA